ncbi:hypothetical protein B842_03320 [Corynebacterium humireducens NBRC 106098 = DSM 45392]|uniref:HK97 gp10 family phage protein n=1 Tax=Corynebacterium humireducens NBRC 106098 = DSM 45392 TaxID=1223515 RepID=A0A0B5D5Y5_9CORY|nr:hypothetical protein [Corynebacterium humireducens]AJE32517.1 hypothetical protein B842_03320 [Corynebacterium humireducens NBRC 106098 = DSM 45392]
MASRFELDGGALRDHLRAEATKLIRTAQRRTLNAAIHRSPLDTGQLENSHRAGNIIVQGTRVSGEVIAEQDYALAVHEGTRPHVIRPRRVKALTWGKGAGRVFARSVNHPGSRPQPWLLNSARAEGTRLGFEVTPVS